MQINQNSENNFYSLTSGSEVFLLGKLLKNSSSGAVHICKNDYYAEKIISLLNCFFPEIEVLELPAWDTNPYDRTSPNISIISKRLFTLSKIKNGLGKNQILVTTANAILTKLIPQEVIKNSTLALKEKIEIRRDQLTKFLVDNSYINVAAATESGEFAIRGSLIDIIPTNQDCGIRIDFFGDEIESIRKYDPLTQITTGSIDEIDLIPASEILLNKENIEKFKQGYLKNFGLKSSSSDQLYEAISNGRRHNGAENLLPL
ncbi:MAG TPA: transcription-repair coupling factor, partial [Alphaproteobacteria bacterium]|nr:transcription-repair coupling factor [Alphaproteobacteria bacterium]